MTRFSALRDEERRALVVALATSRSEGSVRGSFLRVQKIFTYAVRHRLISFSPMDALKKPRLPQNNPNFLTLAQVSALAGRLDTFEPYGLIVRFGALLLKQTMGLNGNSSS